MEKGAKRAITILAAVIVVLVLVVVYVLAIKPAINGYAVNVGSSAYNQGIQYAVVSIMQQAAQCSTSGVPLTYQNQTIHVFALECLQNSQQTQASTQSQTNSSS